MNLLADEGVDKQIVVRLREEGYSVSYVAEMAPGIADDIVLELANKEGLAAVGLGQMNHIYELLNKRIALADRYEQMFAGCKEVDIPQTTPGGKHSYQSFCIFVEDRDRIMQKMLVKGIEVQIGTYSLHMHPAFAEGKSIRWHGSFGSSRYAYDHCLTLPLYHELSENDQQSVVEILKGLLI